MSTARSQNAKKSTKSNYGVETMTKNWVPLLMSGEGTGSFMEKECAYITYNNCVYSFEYNIQMFRDHKTMKIHAQNIHDMVFTKISGTSNKKLTDKTRFDMMGIVYKYYGDLACKINEGKLDEIDSVLYM